MNTGNTIGHGVPFQRTRRITGYLVGSLERFNNAKRAEEKDRVKHTTTGKEEGHSETRQAPPDTAD